MDSDLYANSYRDAHTDAGAHSNGYQYTDFTYLLAYINNNPNSH